MRKNTNEYLSPMDKIRSEMEVGLPGEGHVSHLTVAKVIII